MCPACRADCPQGPSLISNPGPEWCTDTGWSVPSLRVAGFFPHPFPCGQADVWFGVRDGEVGKEPLFLALSS